MIHQPPKNIISLTDNLQGKFPMYTRIPVFIEGHVFLYSMKRQYFQYGLHPSSVECHRTLLIRLIPCPAKCFALPEHYASQLICNILWKCCVLFGGFKLSIVLPFSFSGGRAGFAAGQYNNESVEYPFGPLVWDGSDDASAEMKDSNNKQGMNSRRQKRKMGVVERREYNRMRHLEWEEKRNASKFQEAP